VAVCVALANGLISQWLPIEQTRELQIPNLDTFKDLNDTSNKDSKQSRKQTNAAAPQALNNQVKPFSISSEASSDFKKALEVKYKKKSIYSDGIA
jgi:hypothetical protein